MCKTFMVGCGNYNIARTLSFVFRCWYFYKFMKYLLTWNMLWYSQLFFLYAAWKSSFSVNHFQISNNYYSAKHLRKMCSNTEVFLVRIFLYSDWIQKNTDQKKLRIWTLFTQWSALNFMFSKVSDQQCDDHRKSIKWYLTFSLKFLSYTKQLFFE